MNFIDFSSPIMTHLPSDALFQIFLFLEPNIIFKKVTLMNKEFYKVINGPSFLEIYYKIIFGKTNEKVDDYSQKFKENYEKIKSYKTDILSWVPTDNINRYDYKELLDWIIFNNYYKLLKIILKQHKINEEISLLILDKPIIGLYKVLILRNTKLSMFKPQRLLQKAIKENSIECFDVILDEIDTPIKLDKIENPAYYFINSYYDLVCPIHSASYYGNLNFLKHIQSKGAKMQMIELNYGQTILHIATSQNKLDIMEYILEKKIIDINETDQDGWTSLHIAASKGIFENTELLLKYGAKKNLNTGFGTPLTLAKLKGYNLKFQKLFM